MDELAMHEIYMKGHLRLGPIVVLTDPERGVHAVLALRPDCVALPGKTLAGGCGTRARRAARSPTAWCCPCV